MSPSPQWQLTAIAVSLGIGAIAACSSGSGEDENAVASADTRISDGGAFCEDPARFAARGGVVVDNGDAENRDAAAFGNAAVVNASPLEWQRDVAPASYTQPEAVAYCSALLLDGSGWRLPTVDELSSLVLHPLGLGGSPLPVCVPSIDQTAFPATPPDDFWTGSTRPTLGDAIYTGFFDGRSHAAPLSTSMSVRCVRAAPSTSPPPRSPAPG